jgi:hypothetical protein
MIAERGRPFCSTCATPTLYEVDNSWDKIYLDAVTLGALETYSPAFMSSPRNSSPGCISAPALAVYPVKALTRANPSSSRYE